MEVVRIKIYIVGPRSGILVSDQDVEGPTPYKPFDEWERLCSTV